MDPNSANSRQEFIDSLCQGKVFWLKGNEPFPSEKYHIFVVLNRDPKTGEVLYLVNGTSQILKCYQRLDRFCVDSKETTVCMLAGKYQFITKDTIFNCNTVHSLRLGQNVLCDDSIKDIDSDELSQEDIDSLVNAVIASPLVEQRIKNQIRPSNVG